MSAAGSVCVGLALVLLYVSTASAHAARFQETDPVWQEECGVCHVAYPPRLLPASGWRAVMGGLDRHFGVDAGVDARVARHVTAFLERSAGRRDDGAASPVTRITETRWFRKEHDELPDGVWRRPAVRSASNCPACHTRAESGDYGKRTRKVPQ